MKIHIHEEQFDGVPHPWCGRGDAAVDFDQFEATAPELRCHFCDREWFPHGQPDWHYRQATKQTETQTRNLDDETKAPSRHGPSAT